MGFSKPKNQQNQRPPNPPSQPMCPVTANPGMSSVLFSPLRMRGVTVANRIALAPMDQFCAKGGLADDWHLMHYGKFAVSGIGLIIGEVTAVTPEAPVTPGDLGLYTDAQEAALARVVGFCKEHGSAVMGIQLGHAGQKASTEVHVRGS